MIHGEGLASAEREAELAAGGAGSQPSTRAALESAPDAMLNVNTDDDFRAVVLENMAEGLAVCDSRGRLVFMNATASKMLGWSEDELLGSSAHDAIHYQRADGSPLAEADSALTMVRTEGRTVRIAQDAFTRKDGSIFPVAYSAAPLHSGTSVRGTVVVFHDTTEEQAERTRAQRELDTLSWVGRIRDALDSDRLVLYSQPIVPLSAGGTHSEELLLRMVGQKGELILPNSFLPVAEKYSQVWEIDQWVMTRAALLAAAGPRVRRGSGRLWYRLRELYLSTEAPVQVPEDRHWVRPRLGIERSEPAPDQGDRQHRPRVRPADDRRGRRRQRDTGPLARLRRRLCPGFLPRPAAAARVRLTLMAISSASDRRQPVAGSWDELAGVIAEFDLVPAFAPALERVLAAISTTGGSAGELVAAIESGTRLNAAVLRRAQTV